VKVDAADSLAVSNLQSRKTPIMADARKTETETVDLTKLTEDLRAEVAALRDDLSKRGASLARTGREHASALKSSARAMARDGYAKGEETLDDVLAELKSVEDELADATRRKPFAALGLAALVRFLLGVLFRR
jgi:ElaB/YqjD/DUF883 family membrane-anchored ribosome-binding protein